MKELAKAENGQLVIDTQFITGDFNAGLEETDRESFAIPFLRVIQKMSPQVDEASPQFNPAAKAGMLVNSVTGELYDGKTGIAAVQCAYQRRYTRWAPGEQGSFKGEMLPEVVAKLTDEGKIQNFDGQLHIDGDELSDCRNHYLMILGENGSVAQALLTLSSTQIKKSKQLMSMLSAIKVKADGKLVTPPTWLNIIKITTALESNDKGSWYGLKFELAGFINSQEIYELGKQFHADVMAGSIKVAAPEQDVPETNVKF